MGLDGFVRADEGLFFEDRGNADHLRDHPVVGATGDEVEPIVDIPASAARPAPAEEPAVEHAGQHEDEAPAQSPAVETGKAEGASVGGMSIRKSLELMRSKREQRQSGQGFGDDFISFEANKPAEGSRVSLASDAGGGGGGGGGGEAGRGRALDVPEGMLTSTAGLEVNKRSPWSRGQAYHTGLPDRTVDLHLEILDFVNFIKPTKAEIKRRESLVDFMRQVCAELWPGSELHVFGSYATGMFLPSSDIDMAAIGCQESPVTALHQLAKVLRNDGNFDKIQVIAKAKVPIIKWDDRHSGIALNICIGQKDGIRNTEWVLEQKREIQPLEPLLLVLKQFLYNRDLHETYTGGWGSYLLTMTIISHLQHHPGQGPGFDKPETNLGALLVDYLHLYGLRFNMERIGISVRDGGAYFRKARQGWLDGVRPFLLSVEDPKNPESDLGKNSFNVRNVQRAFEGAYFTLAVPRAGGGAGDTLLGSILQWDSRWDSAFAEHRLRMYKARRPAPGRAPPSSEGGGGAGGGRAGGGGGPALRGAGRGGRGRGGAGKHDRLFGIKKKSAGSGWGGLTSTTLQKLTKTKKGESRGAGGAKAGRGGAWRGSSHKHRRVG